MTRGITVVATMSSVMESAGSAVLPANLFQAQVEMITVDMNLLDPASQMK